jgi:flagellar motor switch protein FliM
MAQTQKEYSQTGKFEHLQMERPWENAELRGGRGTTTIFPRTNVAVTPHSIVPPQNKKKTTNKVLAQDAVDALLRGLSGGTVEAETDVPKDASGIVAFDLTNQDRIIRGRMPGLEIITDRFARLCTNALSNAIHKHVALNPLSTDMLKFGDFMRSLPVPASINIFKLEPLRGNALLVLDARFVFSLVENIFGGAGSQPKIGGREFTRIEQAVVDQMVKITLGTLEESWRPLHDVKLELVRSETNPQFASIVPSNDMVAAIHFEVELNASKGNMVLCLPYATIEPIRSKLNASFQTDRLEVDHTWVARLKERLMKTAVELKINFGSSRITGNQLMRLQVGDVIMLDKGTEDLFTCTIDGVPKYQGTVGTVKSVKGFKIVNEIEPKHI